MRSTRIRARLAIILAGAVTATAMVGALGASPPTASADPSPSAGGGYGVTPKGKIKAAVSGSAPKAFVAYQLRGGYVASGVSLRNRGAGTVSVSGIPRGAKVKAAYLMWSVLGGTESRSFARGTFAGTNITGTKVGSGAGPCWPPTTTGYAYRANVTSKVKGNGRFALRNFASGVRNGSDPFTTTPVAPLAEGASLVVVYAKSTYPDTRVVISNGYAMVSGDTATASVPFGFHASNPVGQVRTTFIGGDGQSADEPASTVNGVPVLGADWDGTDGPLPRYSQGNLWDTDTVNLPNVVHPGDTSARVSVSGGPDCLAWVGQVFSIGRNGAADTDGDKLLDGWEANGYDANGDGIIDVNLPAMGSSVVRKDLYVEMDYMGDSTTCPCYLPKTADLNRIVSIFASAPQANNPNGQTGIRLHLDAGAARGAAYDLGGGNLVPLDTDLNPVVPQFKAIKTANFNPLRKKIFYYMIWGHGYDGGTSSGNAFAIPSDSFLVSLGWWPGGGSSDQKVGTFVHEFGHALGQKHGGNDHGNYKPNYLSVMNYAFQTGGVLRTDGTKYFGYSSFTLPSLNEKNLNEKKGLRSSAAKTYRTKWFCPNGSQKTGGRSDKNLDWTCNKKLSTSVKADINGDGQKTTLGTYNNWGHIVYGGGAVGGGLASMNAQKTVPQEMTLEESLRRR